MKQTLRAALLCILAIGLAGAPALAQTAQSAPPNVNVTLQPPYPGGEDRISLQFAVLALAEQAGLQFDRNAARQAVGEPMRVFVFPRINARPFDEAMRELLEPFALSYRVENGEVIVVPVKITAPGDQKPGTPTSWADVARAALDAGVDRPRRVMLVFPLVETGSPEGDIGLGRGLIALQAMWLSSFAPDRLLDTWDLSLARRYGDHQLLGAGRRVTDHKINAVRAVCGAENYATGTLGVRRDEYTARLTFRGVNGVARQRYSGPLDELHRLPCLIARDVAGYMGLDLTDEQQAAIDTPPLTSTALIPDVAEQVAGSLYFGTFDVPFWTQTLLGARTPWTEYCYLWVRAMKQPADIVFEWGRDAPTSESVAFDGLRALAAMRAFEHEDKEADRAAAVMAPLLNSDPYNAYAIANLARLAAEHGDGYLADALAERLRTIYGEGYLGHYLLGAFLIDYAWDARGGGVFSTVGNRAFATFRERLQRAFRELQTARSIQPLGWEASREMITAAMGLELPREEILKLLDETTAVCPTDRIAYWRALYALQPRWGGSPEELMAFGVRCAETGLYEAGIPPLLYTALAALVDQYSGSRQYQGAESLFSMPEVSARVGPVLRRAVETNPYDYESLGHYLLFAYWNGDPALVEELAQKLKAAVPRPVGGRYAGVTEERFDEIQAWIAAGWPPLHVAARYGDVDSIRRLAGEGADLNARLVMDWSPLHWAARHGHTDAVVALLEAGADPNVRDEEGRTPLYLAADSGYTAGARILLAAGASPDAPTKFGTPLGLAASKGYELLTTMLLEAGANVNARDRWTQTPLHLAALRGRTDIVRMLLEAGAEIDARTDRGDTPLHRAAWKGHVDCVALLLARGADATIKNFDGDTPLGLARRVGMTQVVDYMRVHGVFE